MLLKAPPALSEAQNINMLWAHLMVDELCRLGSSTFCIAPGEQPQPFAVLEHLTAKIELTTTVSDAADRRHLRTAHKALMAILCPGQARVHPP